MQTTNDRIVKFLLGTLLVTCLLSLSIAGHCQATPEVEVRVAPETVEVAAGDAADVAIEVVEVAELYATDLTLTFDPQTIQVEDADPGLPGVQVSLGIFLDPGFVLINDVDNENGIIRFAMTQLNPSKAKSGTGALIVFQVHGEEAGSSSRLSLDDVKLARGNGTAIQPAPVSGQIDVTAPSATVATRTPLPRQSPGTPMPTLTATMTPLPTTPAPLPTPTRTPLPVTPTPEGAAATPLPTKMAEPTLSPTVVSSESEQEGAPPGAGAYDHDATGVTPQPATAATEVNEPPTAVADAAAASPEPAQSGSDDNSEPQPTSDVADAQATVTSAEPASNDVAMAESNTSGEVPAIAQRQDRLDPAWYLLLVGALAVGLAILLGCLAVVLLIVARRTPSS